MENHNIKPEKITKPFQLLAAWLVGLIIVNASFIGGARLIDHPSWGAAVLIIAAVANVPIFIGSIFLLQTKFRPEMQTDDYYYEYKKEERKNELNKVQLRIDTERKQKMNINASIIKAVKISDSTKRVFEVEKLINKSDEYMLKMKYSSSKLLYNLLDEVYSAKKQKNISVLIKKNPDNKFINNPTKEIYPLMVDGLIEGDLNDFSSLKLTQLGSRIVYEINNEDLWSFDQGRVLSEIPGSLIIEGESRFEDKA